MKFLLGWRRAKRPAPSDTAAAAAAPSSATNAAGAHGAVPVAALHGASSKKPRSGRAPATTATASASSRGHRAALDLAASALGRSARASERRSGARRSGRSTAGRSREASVDRRLLSVDDFLSHLSTTPAEAYDHLMLRRLGLILRNEGAAWLSRFIERGGVDRQLLPAVARLCGRPARLDEELARIFDELLGCLLALCSTRQGLYALSKTTDLPDILATYLLSKRAPLDFEPCTKMVQLLTRWCSAQGPLAVVGDGETQAKPAAERARHVLALLRDSPNGTRHSGGGGSASVPARTHDFLPAPRAAHLRRPFGGMVEEMDSPCYRACWLFVFGENAIDLLTPSEAADAAKLLRQYSSHDANPSSGAATSEAHRSSIEYLATEYLCAHLALLDCLLHALPAADERNAVRQQLRQSHFERLVQRFVRKADKSANRRLHLLLSLWATDATNDGWDVAKVLVPSRHRHRRASDAAEPARLLTGLPRPEPAVGDADGPAFKLPVLVF